MTFAVADLRSYLLGRWRLERVLRNRGAAVEGTLMGFVLFTADDGGLRQSEQGTMMWPTHSGPASREYLLRQTTEPCALDVLFTDGRPFHRMDLSTGSWSSDHWCAPDDYRVRYDARSRDRLDFEWDVRGPAKNLLLQTSLFREP
ncbi:hypothetical protein IV498_05285 [Paenarthrobacter sp. Z7-10]|uniref:DUF6314 family protein n=1 Tax=Paenarthrobacter sp. Z7-10 TaxID=2787635 RepID=UPI0022A91D83|nr:DUF6314 family protein [Paenarthrobacter sp. Z7-10]MCZ2402611.1 hypothetical protein [Paenarthrobacter sp. Z7-10]